MDEVSKMELGDLLPHEVNLILHFRKSNPSDQHSIAEYAAECARGWNAHKIKPSSNDDGLIHLDDLSYDFENYF